MGSTKEDQDLTKTAIKYMVGTIITVLVSGGLWAVGKIYHDVYGDSGKLNTESVEYCPDECQDQIQSTKEDIERVKKKVEANKDRVQSVKENVDSTKERINSIKSKLSVIQSLLIELNHKESKSGTLLYYPGLDYNYDYSRSVPAKTLGADRQENSGFNRFDINRRWISMERSIEGPKVKSESRRN